MLKYLTNQEMGDLFITKVKVGVLPPFPSKAFWPTVSLIRCQ